MSHTIKLDDSTFSEFLKKKGNLERRTRKKMSNQDILKILLDTKREIIIVPKKKYRLHRKRALLDEMYPIIHL